MWTYIPGEGWLYYFSDEMIEELDAVSLTDLVEEILK